MISGRRCVGALVALLVASAAVSAQSLGELARQEEARRNTARKATRSFSDSDLRPAAIGAAPDTSPASSSSCYMSVSEGRCMTADEVLARSLANIASPETKKQEPLIRQEASQIRAELTRVRQELNQLSATAGDQSRPAARRAAAADALASQQRILEQVEQRWLKLEKYAAQQRIPREWIEPVPQLTSLKP